MVLFAMPCRTWLGESQCRPNKENWPRAQESVAIGEIVPNRAKLSEEVEELFWSYVVAVGIGVSIGVGWSRTPCFNCYLKFFTNRALGFKVSI